MWGTLDDYPTASVFLYDVFASLVVTLVAVFWLVSSAHAGASTDASAAEGESETREHIERYFITTSMCFFVGWCYITCLRDLTTVVAVALKRDEASINFVGETVVLALFASFLTAALVKLSTSSMRTYNCAIAISRQGPTATRENGAAASTERRPDPMALFGPPLGAGHVHAPTDSVVVPAGAARREPSRPTSPRLVQTASTDSSQPLHSGGDSASVEYVIHARRGAGPDAL